MKNTPTPKRYRLTQAQLVALLTPIASAFAPIAKANDIFKADNADALNATTSWVSSQLPTLNDVAVFDSNVISIPVTIDEIDGVTPRSYMPFTAAASWKGIRVSNAPGVNLSIDSFGAGNPALAIGSSGIDMSAAASGTIFQMFGQALTIGGSQTWKVNDGATLDITNGTLARTAGSMLKIELGANGTGVIKPNATFGGANTVLGYATINGNDFAAVNSSQTALVPGNTLGTYTPNPTAEPPTISTAATVHDVINSGDGEYQATVNGVLTTLQTGTALRIGANITLTGIRFNTPHATGLDWTVDGTGTTRNIGIGGGGLVVGPGVGAKNVIFNGASQFRFGSNSDFYIHQFNTAGDLILNNAMNQSGTNTRLNKDGLGRVILTNDFNSLSGQTTILEGTIQVGNGGATGSVNSGPIANFGTLAFNKTNSWTQPNVISGSGLVQMLGTGVLTLSGANTYTGATVINAGTISFAASNNLGTGAITLNGGALRWASGNATDISSRSVTFGSGGATFDTGANNVTLAESIGNSGSGGLTKLGSGRLTLGGSNTYTGPTILSAGGLVVTNASGSATGSGPVTISNTTVLSGTGTLAGTVSVADGGKVAPGVAGVGTLTVGGFNLSSGALMDLEFTSASAHDKVVVTEPNGLTLNGGALLLSPTGTVNSLTTIGTYNIFQYNGALNGSGTSALTVLNPQPGYAYTFNSDGSFVTLAVNVNGVLPEWAGGSGSWGASANWSDATAAGAGGDYSAVFNTASGSTATVTLDGDRSTKGLAFGSASPYIISAGSGGRLTIDNGVSSAGATVSAGDHTISAPLILNSTIGFTVSPGASILVSGAISGAGGVNKSGAGLLNLTGSNSFAGNVNIVAGTMGFSSLSSLGGGALTISGGILRYNTGNSADISSKSVTVGLNGATLDTNGNDVIFANSIGNNGVGSFTKLGAGSLTFNAANTYGGPTFIEGGTLFLSSNAGLGSVGTGARLTLNGSVLVPTTSFALDNAGANQRPLSIGTNGAELNVAASLNMTVSGAVSGTGALIKTGAGELIMSGLNNGFSGAVAINDGTVRLGSVVASGQTGLGTGPITFGNGTSLYLNGYATNNTNYGILTNAISIPAGVTANIFAPQSATYNGVVSGAGILNLSVDGTAFNVTGAWPAFTGTMNISKTPTGDGTDTDDYCLNGTHDLSAAVVNVGPGVRVRQNYNPPSGAGSLTTHRFGELHVSESAILAGNTVGDRYNVYSVGALNTDSVISGQFIGVAGGFGHAFPLLTKEGTGMLTLNGTKHMMATPSTVADRYSLRVNAGTLRVLGAVERFYKLPGVDGVFGNADDSITQTLPTGDFQTIEPGPNLVAVGATLSGNGRLGGITTINGELRPDASGLLGGKLTFTGAATVTLDPNATTTFDLYGKSFTGLKSDASGAINLANSKLVIHFHGNLYNDTYNLIDGAPLGDFQSVTVITPDSPSGVQLSGSGGVWSGSVNNTIIEFTSATGQMSVSGGVTGVLPSAPAGLGAAPGDGTVTLTWNPAANASSYLIKRSTIAGGPYVVLNPSLETVTTSYVDSGLVNGTTYYYVIQGKNDVGLGVNSVEVSATPMVSALTSLEQWRLEQFGVSIDDDTVLAGDNEDFDGDGLANLMEYALGTNPKVTNASPITLSRNGNNLVLVYPRTSPADTKLTYTVLGSSNLTSGFTVAEGLTNTVGSTSTYTDNENISVTGARRFLRLSVTYTP